MVLALLAVLGVVLVLVSVLGSTVVVWAQTITTTETLPNNTPSADASKRVVTHDAFNEGATLNSGTTPPVSAHAAFVLTLSAGAAVIDLRALTGTNGAIVDGNGLKVQLFRVKNLGANPMTFTFGAATPYPIFGASGLLEVPVGGVVTIYGANNLPAISNTVKHIDVSGTGTQTAEITIEMG